MKAKMIFDHSVGGLWLSEFNHFIQVLGIVLGAKNKAENKTNEVLIHVWLVCTDLSVYRQ